MRINVGNTQWTAILPKSLKDIHVPALSYANGTRLTMVSSNGYNTIRMTWQSKRNVELCMQEVTYFSET